MASFESTRKPSRSVSPWLNTAEAADYIRSTPATMKAWRSKGGGPRYHVIGVRMVRYHTDDLDAFVRGEADR